MSIEIRNISKRFGNFVALDNINLDIPTGELVALLGPSGCGKTTMLRMIAGFEHPDAGTITIDGKAMTGVPPYRRPIGLVFQNLALFPHKTVFDNIAFGLRVRRQAADTIARSVDEALALVERIRASGRVAIVQSYLADVDRNGETALVFVAGEISHVLNKRPVLRGEGEAPLGAGPLQAAAVMTEDGLVVPAHGDDAQREFAAEVMAAVGERFGTPLYARVDIAADDDGQPLLMELEAIEPCLYFATVPGSGARFARAVLAC